MFSLANFDPRTKFMLLLCLSTAALAVENIWFLAGLLVFTSLLMALGGISVGSQLRQARIAVSIVIFLFIIQTLFIRTGQPLLRIKEVVLITTDGLHVGAYLSIRILIIILSALIILTGQSRDYLLAMTRCKIPYEIAFMTMVGFHFFPLLKEEAKDIFYSVQLRGTELKKTSLRKKLAVYFKISLPILVGALEKAKAMAAAMEARCFRIYPYRTYMRKLTLKTKDKIALIILPVLTAGFIFFGITTPVAAADAQKAVSASGTEMQTILSWTGDPAHSRAITWKSHKENEESYVLYRTADQSEKESKKVQATVTEVKAKEYYRYEAHISGLKQNTEYTYKVVCGEKVMEENFTTAKENTDAFSFLYFGDVQYELRDEDYETWGKFAKEAYEANPAVKFALMGGDMVEKSPDIRDWNAFLTAASPVFSKISMVSVPGNHETSITPAYYLKMTAEPENGPAGLEEEFYSLDYGNCHFVGLNTCYLMEERRKDMGEEAWKKQLKKINQWLAEDLEKSNKTWNMVTMHHPAYALEDPDEPYALIKENWAPLFEKHGVQVVFCGHQHVYMRTKNLNGVTYIMGNSGQKKSDYWDAGTADFIETMEAESSNYQIIQIKEDALELTSYDEEGKIIDDWKINSQGEIIGNTSLFIFIIIAVMVIAAVCAVLFFKKVRKRRRAKPD